MVLGMRLNDLGTRVFIAYLFRSIVTLRPDDPHFLSVLTLETFDFVRYFLVEEVGIG